MVGFRVMAKKLNKLTTNKLWQIQKYTFLYSCFLCWVLYNRFLAFYGGPEGFRELREAGRKQFHLSWYLFVPGVTSYDVFSFQV